MATIKAFRGVRYNPQRIPDLSVVVSQPHDRVQGLQEEYYNLSPYNVIRLIKGKEWPGDSAKNNVYTRARDAYRAWLRDSVLIRDDVPGLYFLRQTFSMPDGNTKVRQGLIAALELARFDEGIVLPHERTLTKSMIDRLNLLRATEVNFSSVFMLYPGGQINELLQPTTEQPPAFQFHDLVIEREVLQQFWTIADPQVIGAVAEEMAAKRNLIIADGHHRYEMALQYRDELRAKYPDAPSNASFNYREVALVSMNDPGLVILPTHRLIHSYDRMSGAEALERAKECFEIRPVRDLQAELNEVKGETHTYFGFHDGSSALVTLRDPRVMDRLLPDATPEWRRLDVAVVHELFIERVLGISKEVVAQNGHIEFLRDLQRGYDAVSRGEANFLLVMNPTRIDQVQACSTAGERMPQKSTDFYPKIVSGLVALPVHAAERL